MSTVPYQRKWAEQYYDWQEIQEYAKDKDMEWSEEQCKDFLDEHEDEMSESMREVADDLIENWLYDIKSDLDEEEEEEDDNE